MFVRVGYEWVNLDHVLRVQVVRRREDPKLEVRLVQPGGLEVSAVDPAETKTILDWLEAQHRPAKQPDQPKGK